jgi:CheY-like chemotaxis protein
VSNAVKFTERGEVHIRADYRDGQLQVDVRDTGIGIKTPELLFQEFVQSDDSTTRRFGGTGLGLAISKRLVELMRGSIWVESTLGAGSIFSFRIPAPIATPSVVPSGAPSNFSGYGTVTGDPRVLLVEDNKVNQMVAQKILERLGCKVVVAENGKRALGSLAKARFDIVFMDCQMPEMDGFEATRRIRADEALPSTLPIVAMTANAMPGDRERCLAAGMNDYLAKPIKGEQLQAILLRWLPKEVRQGKAKLCSYRAD